MADHPTPKSAHPGVYYSHDLAGIRPHLRDALVAGLEGWFPDLSEFQGAVDWNALGAAHAAGTISAVVIRAGFGTLRADRQFAANQAGARAHGIPAIYYWFNYPTFNTPQAEAAKFNSVVGPLQSGEAQCADVEDDPPSSSIFPRGQAGVDWVAAFLAALESPQNATWWYTYPFLLSVIPFSQLFGVWPFWEADYSATPDSAFGAPIARQFTDCGSTPGVSGCCDQSRVLKAPLSQWLTPGLPAPQVSGGDTSMFHPTIPGRVDDVYLSAGGRVIHTISQIFAAPPVDEDWGIPAPTPPPPAGTKFGVVPGSLAAGWSPDGLHFLVRCVGTDGVLYYRQENFDAAIGVEHEWTPLTAPGLPAASTSPAFLHTHDVTLPSNAVNIVQSGPAKTSA